MKFGLKQIGEKSPLVISRAKRAINFTAFAILSYSPKICEWTGWTNEGFMTTLGLIGLGINVIGIMFGESPEEKYQFDLKPDKPKDN